MDISPFLQAMVEHGASDLFFSAGAPPHLRIQGRTRRVGQHVLTGEEVHALAYSLMNDRQSAEFERELEMNFGLGVERLGRFRVNVYRQRGTVAMVVRLIKPEIPSLAELNLPEAIAELVLEPRGLVLVVGSTGSGKTTTLASMIDHRNRNRTGHILTIEDPIEFLHQHRRSLVDQREVGVDTLSFASALRNAMREAPDVVLIGEIRDRETMQHAIAYADTGHLCLSTLHANNADQALERIVNFFPDANRPQVLLDLSLNLRAVVAMRLIEGVEGKRVPAVEILKNTPYVADLIRKGEVTGLKDAMGRAQERGMQTFDQSLYALYRRGMISARQAVDHADSRADVALRIRLEKAGGTDGGDLSLSDQEP